jgi:hypothetical protein
MEQAPTFFLPGSTPENEDEIYAKLAKACDAVVPPSNKRIYSIRFIHDGIDWTATVGEPTTGTSRRTMRRKSGKVEVEHSHSDLAKLRAIFEGSPSMVVLEPVRSRWSNPFMAGSPHTITYFSTPRIRSASKE